eukprot:GILI01011914.1.p1 GENE.GILI01011914.1~~GILI01011914.1.p1  ORF type:complete len:410 (-),score=119.91 GILI01011914.1:176-1405(-)
MSKKSKGRGKGRIDEDDESLFDERLSDSDTMSVRSLEEEEGQGGAEKISVETGLEERIEQLTEKRGSTRESALKYIVKQLQNQVLADFLMGRQETLQDYLLQCIRKGGSTEGSLAAHALSLLYVTIGAESETLFPQVVQTLMTAAADHQSAAVRAAATHALAFTGFVGCGEEDKLQELVLFFEGLLNAPRSETLEAALDSWSLVATLLPASELAEPVFSRLCRRLRALLDHEDGGVKSAAGMAIALLFEARWTYLGADRVYEEPFAQEICNRVEELSTENIRYVARKNRQEQRTAFRDIRKTVESGDVPELKLSVLGDKVVLDNWRSLSQYQSLKDVLESGVTSHLGNNEMVRDLLGLGPVPLKDQPADKPTAREKRAFFEENHRVRSQQRARERGKRARAPSFQTEDS